MKKAMLFLACLLIPQIMLPYGLFLLSKNEAYKKNDGKFIALISSGVIIVGSLLWLLFYTPLFKIEL